MTIETLQFVTVGCCGTHRMAHVERRDGLRWTVYDDGEAGYRIVPTRDGVLCGAIESGLTADQVAERLLA